MHFGITGEHRFFFDKHGWVEFEDLFDLDHPEKLPRSRKLAEIAADLMRAPSVRLVSDQPLPDLESVAAISSVHGVVGGVILCLSGESEEPMLPSKPGSGVFLKPNTPIDFTSFSGDYLLITYGGPHLIYTPNPKDALGITYKDQGYSAGDRVSDASCPTLFRG